MPSNSRYQRHRLLSKERAGHPKATRPFPRSCHAFDGLTLVGLRPHSVTSFRSVRKKGSRFEEPTRTPRPRTFGLAETTAIPGVRPAGRVTRPATPAASVHQVTPGTALCQARPVPDKWVLGYLLSQEQRTGHSPKPSRKGPTTILGLSSLPGMPLGFWEHSLTPSTLPRHSEFSPSDTLFLPENSALSTTKPDPRHW